MSEFKTAEDSRDVGKKTATATLPGMTIEISHHRPPEGDREEIAIRMQAMPSFEAFDSFLGATNPFAFWANATQLSIWVTPNGNPKLQVLMGAMP